MKIQAREWLQLQTSSAPTSSVQAPEEFEALFARQLLKQARECAQSLRKEESSPEESLYKSFFDEKVAEILAQERSLGVAEAVESYLAQNGGGAGSS